MRFLLREGGSFKLTDEVETITLQYNYGYAGLSSDDDVRLKIYCRNGDEHGIILGLLNEYHIPDIERQCELAMDYIIQELELGKEVIKLPDGCVFRNDSYGVIRFVESVPF